MDYKFTSRVKTKTILQVSATECGVAALAIIFAYYKVNLSMEVLRDRCGTSRDGSMASTLIRVAREYGFEADAFRVEIDDLRQVNRPIIAYWKFNHFVVINGVGNDKVFVNDPAQGQIGVSFEEFDKAFTGVIIEIAPTQNVVKVKPRPLFFPLVREFLSQFHREMLFIFVCMFVVMSGPLFNSALSSVFVNYCIIQKYKYWIPYLSILSLSIAILFTWATYSQKMSQFRLCAKASIVKSSRLMAHILQLPLLFYSLRMKPEIVYLLSKAETVANSFIKSATTLAVSGICCMVSFVILLKIDSYLVEVLCFIMLIMFVPLYFLMKMNYSFETSAVNITGQYQSCCMSIIKNNETIKCFGLESNVLSQWIAVFFQKLTIQDRSNTVFAVTQSMYKSYHLIAMLMTIFVGGYRVASGYLSMGHLMAFYALQNYFSGQLSSIFYELKDMQSALASHARVNDISEYKVDGRYANNKSMATEATPCALTCENVDFYYNRTQPPVLQNITLKVLSGDHVAFVGSSGSGKSTLVKVLCNLYSAARGRVNVFDRDIQTLCPKDMACHFAYVSQDVTLFTGTLYDNLTLWSKSISQDAITAALTDACLDDVIATRGLYADVKENGDNFSGGEKSRINIARALIQNASILVLDEATAALDIKTEQRLLANLRKRNMTVIYVAHRLSTVKRCDAIYVLKDGVIVESGNHAELLQNKGQYYDLVQREVRL